MRFPRLKGAARALVEVLLPTRDLEGRAPALTRGLDPEAWLKVAFIEAPACDGCGLPFEHDLGAGVRCVSCQARPRLFSRARAACLYDDASRDLILQLKHADRTDLADLFARWIARSACDLLEEADAVVPVPLHRWRLLKRRFNQAAEIARPVARRFGVSFAPHWLERRRADTQAGKSAKGRRRTVTGAFAVPQARRAQLAGKRILLIDDVMTTGATAEACARTLLRAGATAVDVAVVAKVPEVKD